MSISKELIRVAKVLADFDCLPATDGNFSARLKGDKILLTKTGIEKRCLSENDLVEVGLSEDSPAAVSSEWPMHQLIYRSRKDVNCILHVHSPGLTAFAAARKLPDTSLLTEAAMAIGEMVLVPYAQPGSSDMGTQLLEASLYASVYLLSNHGALSVGKNVTETLHRLERAEFLARVELSARLIGGAVSLNPDELSGLIH